MEPADIPLEAPAVERQSDQQGHGVARLRGDWTVLAGGIVRSRSFSAHRPAGGDARSGALALAQASDALLAELRAWTREP